MFDRLRDILRLVPATGFARAPAPVPGSVEAPARASLYVGVGLLCAAGALTGYLFVPEPQAHASHQPETRVLGRAVELSADRSALALQLARAYLRQPVTLNVGPWQFTSTREKLGARVDMESLRALLAEAQDHASPLRRVHAQERGDGPLELPIPAELDARVAEPFLLRVKDQVAQRPRDARVDLRTGEIIAEQRGLSLDVQGTLDALATAMFSGATRIEARVLRADVKRTQKELTALDFSTVLGAFESRYNVADGDRSYNLRVAARHVDGIVLMPGEVFDFNALVGERSEANGFRPAPVIAGGELTDGVGGGTCQIAGTLHAAVFFAGLPFLERNSHTRPSSYLKLGLDATVAYPKLNFVFRNDLPAAVAIGVTVDAGRVRVELKGAPALQREVSFVRRIDKVTPYTESVREDASLPRGVKVLAQRGVPGFDVTSFRLIREQNGDALRRERHVDAYPPTTQIWRVGTGAPAAAGYVAPRGDTHGEYRADEYLILTKPVGSEALEESVRREGRTGLAGWTAREGMPQAP